MFKSLGLLYHIMAFTPYIIRLLLVAFLPALALFLYFEGQHYDPALINFKSSEQGIERAFFPSEIDGYIKKGEIRHFTFENLYEYVNGHAEYFIDAGFKDLFVAEYIRKGSQQGQSEMIAEIYDMARPLQSFGVFSDEAEDSDNDIQIGTMGTKTPQGITFIKGPYFIKIVTFNENAPYEKLAQAIDSTIKEEGSSFSLFARFPDLGTIVSTRFIKKDYRGLGFVTNVLERQYEVNGENVGIALIMGKSNKSSQQLMSSFFNFFKENDVNYTEIERENRKFYKIMDPYEGDWFLVPFDDLVVGVYGAGNEELVMKIKGQEP
jgi:hypothetical protein